MRRRRITASKVGLALECSYWLDPDVVLPDDDGPTEARDDGTALHARIQHDDCASACADSRVIAARSYMAALGDRHIMREPAFGFDGHDARHIGTGRESYVSAPDCDVTGTADLVVDLGGGEWLVADWKSGEHGATHAREQMRALGALVLRAFGGDVARLEAVHLPAGEPARVYEHGVIDALDGDALLYRLHAIEHGPPSAGDHCADYYCTLRGRCPAYVEAAALVPAEALVTARRNPLVEGVVDHETARVAADLLPLAKRRIEEVERELRAYAEAAGEVDLCDGRRYAPVTQTRQGIDGKAALALAERAGADIADLSACMTSSTFTVWKRIGKRKVET